jgi:hypothetical protein
MLESAVNRLLHQPTLRLRQAAVDRGQDALPLDQLSSALSELFALDAESEAVSSPDNAEPSSPLEQVPEPRVVASRS